MPAHVGELRDRLSLGVPPGVESEELRSNIPWNSPIVTVTLRRMSQFLRRVPPAADRAGARVIAVV